MGRGRNARQVTVEVAEARRPEVGHAEATDRSGSVPESVRTLIAVLGGIGGGSHPA
jgi:hypothetical protein